MAENEVVVGTFGKLLRNLRDDLRGGERSVQWVVERLANHTPPIDTNQGVVSSYEQGWVLKPDPVVLWGLAGVYNVPLEGLMEVLSVNRGCPELSIEDAHQILKRHYDGPNPLVAAEAIRQTSVRLLVLSAEIAKIAELKPSGGQATGARDDAS